MAERFYVLIHDPKVAEEFRKVIKYVSREFVIKLGLQKLKEEGLIELFERESEKSEQ